MTDDTPDADETYTNPSLWEGNKARRCDACWLKQDYLVEIPRSRARGSTEPARMRLCFLHAQNVLNADTNAVAHPMKQETL